ncbi:MAG: 1-acyl-sn-glycerol-3-phosphate acyltransferase [Planctomycetota bacterium]
MQDIIVEKPYKFVPPHRGNFMPSFIQTFKITDKYLSYFDGVTSHEVRNVERLKESKKQGHGIVLAPNHCRYADPLAMGWIAREAGVHVYAMASWHLFNQGWVQSFAMRMCGGFSVYREGLDRSSLDTAIDAIVEGVRPLVIFPEGTVFRTNDRIQPLLDGVAFLARSAARKRKKAGTGKVVIHPIAIKYLFGGNLAETVEPVLQRLEQRITWEEPKNEMGLLERIERLSEALFSLKEIQFLGAAQMGNLQERKYKLIDRLLSPLEVDLLGKVQQDDLLPRIKQLRTKLVPELTEPDTSEKRKATIWKQLSEIYVAQMIESYPEGYLDDPTEMRVLETIERLDEDVHDHSTIHRPLHAILEVGEAIEIDPAKPPRGEPDPIMVGLENALLAMLETLSKESKPFEGKSI